MEDFNRIFDATDYVWVMWNGTHTLRTPWEGHSQVKRLQKRRNDVTVGNVALPSLILIEMWSPDFPEHEPVTWYGVASQWNDSEGVFHNGHYNNILALQQYTLWRTLAGRYRLVYSREKRCALFA